MQLIAHQELASNQASITFNSIPQTFTDLLLVFSTRADNTNVPYSNTELLFNSSSSGFSAKRMFGAGSGGVESYSAGNLGGLVSSNGATANAFGSTQIYIFNYTSGTSKSYYIESVSENNSTSSYQELIAGVWANNAAVNSVTVKAESTRNLVQYSSASLYGINKFAPSPAKATGGTVLYDAASSSWVHTFTSSGTFTPTQNLTNVEYLIIGGGGGGGSSTGVQYSSGGGAGGYRSSVTGELSGGGAAAESKLSLASGTAYTVTVGAGGAATAQGSDSSFAGITSLGGGRGRGESFGPGYSGGSGSGGTKVSNVGGAGTAGQGYAGGWGSSSGSYSDSAAGGGGGAGGIGQAYASDWFTNSPLAGGDGRQSSITGALTWYAAGGCGAGYYSGGRTNGIGGGTPSDKDGTANTGSGGGGGRFDTGGAGGSGIVVIRYKA
jgi:hypothetical protein